MKRTRVNVIAIGPPYVTQIIQMSDMLDFQSRETASVFHGGGAIPQEIGQVVADKVNLFNVNGSTEVGIPSTIRKAGDWAKNDWAYLRYWPNSGFVLRKTFDEFYEAFIVREHGLVPPVFKLFPGIEEYGMGDLFSKHPDDPSLRRDRSF
jgi:hypothetical protein